VHVLYRMTYSDQEAAKRKLDRGLVRRVGHYAKPYQGMLIGFLVTIVLEALLSLAPPLLFKAIVDNAIADKDTGYLTQLAALVVAAAVGVSLLGLAERCRPPSARASSTTCAPRCSTTCSASPSPSSPAPRPAPWSAASTTT
jgi:hypothetical protein